MASGCQGEQMGKAKGQWEKETSRDPETYRATSWLWVTVNRDLAPLVLGDPRIHP